jgi:MFS family permease
MPARTLITVGAGALGVGLAGMALSPSLIPAVVAAAVAGVGNGVEAVAARTALQELVEERWMALVMSFSESLNEAAPGIGIVLGGAIAALTDSRVALGVGAAGAVMVAVAAWAVLNPQRSYRPATADSPRL